MRRGVVVRLAAVGLGAAAIAFIVAFFVPWLPTGASKEAGRIDFVFWFVSIICILIFALVASVILYAVVRFRAQPGDDSDGAPIHGHTGLEIVWTAVPAGLVTAISIVSAVALAKNDHLPRKHMVVKVTAQQFAWSFDYPSLKNLKSPTLVLPVHTPVQLRMHSLDVNHSFWVPQFRQKQDLVPGLTTTVIITPTKIGTYPIICTELCGLGHAVMRSRTMVMSKSGFANWAKSQGKQQGTTGGGGGARSGKAAFTSNGCSGCHTFKPAGSSGTTGPDLDKLAAEARRAGKPLPQFVRESIVKPDAYVERGYQPGIMPPNFGQLPKAQLDALVKFLLSGAKS